MSVALLNVLVLGVGGSVSQGILKALALSKISTRVVSGCVSPLSFGLYTTDRSYITPLAGDPAFPGWLIQTCRNERIHAVLSGVEPVLAVMANHAENIRNETGAICIVSHPDQLSITSNKLSTCNWLQRNGLNYPRYAHTSDRDGLAALVKECGYPLIAKPQVGKSAVGLFKIRTPSDVEYVSSLSDYIVEEYLGDENSEYTTGCFGDKRGRISGVIVMRRELQQGTTYRAIIGDYPEVRAEAIRIAECLKPVGPCNIQLRISSGRVVCFEIDLRFSGTTPIRAHFGFNEVEAVLRHYVLGEEEVGLPHVTSGVALRYWNEMYVKQEALDSLIQTGHLGLPSKYVRIEDYGMRS